MSSAVIIAINEDYFKKYLTVCGYLQLNPTIAYTLEEINKRSDKLLANVIDTPKAIKKLQKDLIWFNKSYLKLISDKWYNFGFMKRTSKMLAKGNLVINTTKISDELTTFDLTNNFYTMPKKN